MLSNHRSSRAHTLSALGLLSLGFACSDGEVDLGSGVIAQDLRQPTRCAESPVIEGDVHVASQSELESLAGCEVIRGDLSVELFAEADLAPLASLRVVEETLSLGALPARQPETPEEEQALQALQAEGYLASLHGLEALERIGDLVLYSVQVSDLSELESLGSLSSFSGFDLLELQSVAGLERAKLAGLTLSNVPSLTSLDSVHLKDVVGGVYIDTAPVLQNIDALASVGIINTALVISRTGLESLPELALDGASQIIIEENPELADIDGLAGLGGSRDLWLNGNPKLRSLPVFSELLVLDTLIINGNGVESISLSFPAFSQPDLFGSERPLAVSAPLVQISYNPQLTSVEMPAGFGSVQYFSVQGNPQLAELDLGTLQRSDLLLIDDNATLASVAAPQLATVDTLVVTDNPQLTPSAFDAVQTFARELSGNAAP